MLASSLQGTGTMFEPLNAHANLSEEKIITIEFKDLNWFYFAS